MGNYNFKIEIVFVLWVPEHRLGKTKGTKNDNTNAKQEQTYTTLQTIEENEYRYAPRDSEMCSVVLL